MSNLLIHQIFHCPYCGELIETCIDVSQGNQQTIEDCSVCCRPIDLSIEIDGDMKGINLTAHTDSE